MNIQTDQWKISLEATGQVRCPHCGDITCFLPGAITRNHPPGADAMVVCFFGGCGRLIELLGFPEMPEPQKIQGILP